MTGAPLATPVLARLGPLAITQPTVVTWAIMLLLTALAILASRHLLVRPGRWQIAIEATVTGIEEQLRQAMQADPRPFLPLLGTLFLFLAAANLSGLLPGVTAPTASIETDAALALVVLVATQAWGVSRRGLKAYLAGFARPNVLMLPLNLLAEVTRTFSLMVRLFGNIMSGHFVIAIVLSLAGLLVPVPLMALEMILGLIQAYIFTVLSAVFIGAAARTDGNT